MTGKFKFALRGAPMALLLGAAMLGATQQASFAQNEPPIPFTRPPNLGIVVPPGPRPDPSVVLEMKLSDILNYASVSLLGDPRDPAYGFRLLLEPKILRTQRAVRLLSKGIEENPDYAFGGNIQTVLNALAADAKSGSVSAIIASARIHERGVDIPKDDVAAYKLYRQAAQAGSETGRQEMARVTAMGIGTYPDKTEAMKWADLMGPTRRSDAYLMLAQLYAQGPEMVRDPAMADWLINQSVALDPANGRKAGELLLAISTSPSATEKARQMLQTAAAAGDYKAVNALGAEDAVAEPTDDPIEALTLYGALAQQGNPQAVRVLAGLLSNAAIDDETRKTILATLLDASAANSVDAMKAVGEAYLYGIGTPVSFQTGFEYYLKAAEAGDVEAQYFTGVSFANGVGTQTNVAQAREWLQKSADAGYPLAQTALTSLILF